MAIQFVNNLDINQNYLEKAAIENLAADPASGVLGQLIFNTNSGVLKVCTTASPTAAVYTAVGGGVESIDLLDSTFIDLVDTGTAAIPELKASLSATGTPDATKYLRGDNAWEAISAIPGTYDWDLQTDSGAGAKVTVGSGDTVVFTSGNSTLDVTNSGLSTSINLPTTAVTAGSYTYTALTVDAYGRITAASNGTAPITPSNATITLNGGAGMAISGGDFTLNQAADEIIEFDIGAGSGIQVNSTDVQVDYLGTNNIITKAGTASTIALTDIMIYEDGDDSNVKKIAVSDLLDLAPQGDVEGIDAGTYISITDAGTSTPTVNALGTATPYVAATDDSKLVARDADGYAYVKTPASGDSTTKIATTAFVQGALTGLLEFKGGFNANTGDLDSPLTGDLYVDVAIAVGDYYVVTTAGDFFGNTATPLTPGDSVICQTAKTAGNATEADFIVVQSDTDLATLTTPGIGNVNGTTGQIGVTYSNGTATVTNLDRGSSQNIFKNVASDSGTAVADNNNDTLTVVGAGSITTAVVNDTLTITGTDNQGSLGKNVLLDTSLSYVGSDTSGGITTFAVDVADASVFGTGVTAVNVKCEVINAATSGANAGQTVYADVTRGVNAGGETFGSTSLNIAFSGTVASTTYRVLLTYLG
jgi:hypothetical protein